MANTTAQEHLGNLKNEANKLIKGSLSANTNKAYTGALSNFIKFLSHYGIVQIFRVPIDHLLYFIAHLSTASIAYRTSILYISALSYIYKIRGVKDNTQTFIVKMQGLHRSRGVTADSRTLLFVGHLMKQCYFQRYFRVLFIVYLG